MQRFNQRQGFLVSAILHLTILMILISRPPSPAATRTRSTPAPWSEGLVFLPPPALLRQAAAPSPVGRGARARPPRRAPTPAPAAGQGPDQRGAAVRRAPEGADDPAAGGRPDQSAEGGDDAPRPPRPRARGPPRPAPAETAEKAAGVAERPGRQGLRLPPGLLGQQPRGEEGLRPLPGPIGPSIEGAVEGVTRRAQRESRAGIPTGTGQNLGGLYFDPQGADFTLWINRFKDEVYRNWIVPQAALFGAARGHVDFEFTVERDGSMSALRLLKSSGTASLDRAAQNALTSSRLLPLPDDYGPPRVTMTSPSSTTRRRRVLDASARRSPRRRGLGRGGRGGLARGGQLPHDARRSAARARPRGRSPPRQDAGERRSAWGCGSASSGPRSPPPAA